jgi:uncharacterized protein YchJ
LLSGALLARWLPLSLFQASALVIAATTAIAPVTQTLMTLMHLQMNHADLDDDSHWEPHEHDACDTLLSTPNLPKVARNEPSPCGSGQKSKNCCGKATPN